VLKVPLNTKQTANKQTKCWLGDRTGTRPVKNHELAIRKASFLANGVIFGK